VLLPLPPVPTWPDPPVLLVPPLTVPLPPLLVLLPLPPVPTTPEPPLPLPALETPGFPPVGAVPEPAADEGP